MIMKHLVKTDNRKNAHCNSRYTDEEWKPPRCFPNVCKSNCPYKNLPWDVEIINVDMPNQMKKKRKNKCIVSFGKQRDKGCIVGCAVVYPRRLYDLDEIQGKEIEFMKSHNTYLMIDCPMEVEHMMSSWNRKRRKKKDMQGDMKNDRD